MYGWKNSSQIYEEPLKIKRHNLFKNKWEYKVFRKTGWLWIEKRFIGTQKAVSIELKTGKNGLQK